MLPKQGGSRLAPPSAARPTLSVEKSGVNSVERNTAPECSFAAAAKVVGYARPSTSPFRVRGWRVANETKGHDVCTKRRSPVGGDLAPTGAHSAGERNLRRSRG